MNVETVTAIIAALGGPVIIIKAIDVYKATKSGRAAREKAENRSALGRLAISEERADDEANWRRAIEEWAGELVYLLKQIGFPEDKIPVKPRRETKVNS